MPQAGVGKVKRGRPEESRVEGREFLLGHYEPRRAFRRDAPARDESQEGQMKLRRTAALVLVGWYLMTPPLDRNREHDPSAPISRWAINGRYDTAAKCAKAQMQNINYWNHVGNEQMLDAFGQSACIPTNDSRLKSK
jgi:hypothetical protein